MAHLLQLLRLPPGALGQGPLLVQDAASRCGCARTVTNPIRPEETWIFLDGDTPASYWPYAAASVVALLLVFMTGWFFLRAFRVYRRLSVSA